MKPSKKSPYEQEKAQLNQSSSHVKTLLKIKKQRTQGDIKPPIPLGPMSSTSRTSFKGSMHPSLSNTSTPKLINADLAKAGLNQFTYYHGNQSQFEKIVHKKSSMKDQDRIEYQQIKNAQVKDIKKELSTFQGRQKEEKERTKKNFQLMDSMLEDLNQWRQKRSADPQIKSNKPKTSKEEIQESKEDPSDPIYLTDLQQQVEEESHGDRVLFDKKFKQAYANHKIPTKGQSQKVMNAEKEAEEILQKYENKKNDYEKLQELYDSKIKREIMQLESKGQFLQKQIDIINENSKEEKKIFAQIDDITSDIQKWETDLTDTLKDLTWLENSQKLKVPSIQEEEQDESEKENEKKQMKPQMNSKYTEKIKQIKNKSKIKKANNDTNFEQQNEIQLNIQDPNLKKMLDDIDNEFKSIDDLLK